MVKTVVRLRGEVVLLVRMRMVVLVLVVVQRMRRRLA
jgi:hypothetical protein